MRGTVVIWEKETAMTRAHYPLIVRPSRAVRHALGPRVPEAGVAAYRAALLKNKGAEMAFMQIQFEGVPIAFSTKIGAEGDVIVELDEGVPSLSPRDLTEDELRRAEQQARRKRRD